MKKPPIVEHTEHITLSVYEHLLYSAGMSQGEANQARQVVAKLEMVHDEYMRQLDQQKLDVAQRAAVAGYFDGYKVLATQFGEHAGQRARAADEAMIRALKQRPRAATLRDRLTAALRGLVTGR